MIESKKVSSKSKSLCLAVPSLKGFREASLLHHQPETIAMNIDNLDIGIIFQILAQLGNIHIHASSVKVSIAAPDAL